MRVDRQVVSHRSCLIPELDIYSPIPMQFDSRLAGGSGYLELIWRTDVPREPGANPQAIAYVTDVYGTRRKPWFCETPRCS